VFREKISFTLNNKISKDSDPAIKRNNYTSRNDYMKNGNYCPATKKTLPEGSDGAQ